MVKSNSYYLAEVLIAVFIFSFSSLALFKHQWHLSKKANVLQQYWVAVHLLNNLSEHLIAGDENALNDFTQQAKNHLPDGSITFTRAERERRIVLSWSGILEKQDKNYTLLRVL